MLFNPTYRPRLRPVEAFAAADGVSAPIGIRDHSGLSGVLTVSRAAMFLITRMDGRSTVTELASTFIEETGHPITVEQVWSVVEKLNAAWLLEGPGFEAHYESLTREYRALGVRPMLHSAALHAEGGEALFRRLLAESPPSPHTGRALGLVVPHLDYPRGAPCYAAGYACLPDRAPPGRVIVLGTNHFGRSSCVVTTANSFETPFGVTLTDLAFVERIESECGSLRRFEFDHAREHSVELQVAWLQHLLGADRFKLVAFLCPDPCGPTGTAPRDGEGVDLATFSRTLGRLIEDDPVDTLLVAGADFSHVGQAFGDESFLDDAMLERVAARDRQALEWLEVGQPRRFVDCLAADDNSTRVCSAGCLFAIASALPTARATRLAYHQAVDHSSQTCVTCAAVVYTAA